MAPIEHEFPANPYAPPGSDLNTGLSSGSGAELADRGARLGAAMLDGLLFSIPLLPAVVVGVYVAVREQAAAMAQTGGTPGERSLITLGIAGGVGVLGMLAIAVYQWVLISRTGQSLGKKWTGIRIERVDGARLTFGSGVFLRNWVPKLIGSIPYMGALFHLVDCLFIFRDDRRCIHDHIAGTRVVRQPR